MTDSPDRCGRPSQPSDPVALAARDAEQQPSQPVQSADAPSAAESRDGKSTHVPSSPPPTDRLPSPSAQDLAQRNPAFSLHTLPLDTLFALIQKEFFSVERATLPMEQYNFTTSLRYPTRNRYSNILAIEETLFPSPTPARAEEEGATRCPDEAETQKERRPVFSSSMDTGPTNSARQRGSGNMGGLRQQQQQQQRRRREEEEIAPSTAPPPFPYFNANTVALDNVEPVFIASQAPLPNTFEDFYRTLWENRIGLVIMLTSNVENGMLKADRYWPPSESDVQAERLIWTELRLRRNLYEAELGASTSPPPPDSGGRRSGAGERPGRWLSESFGSNDVKDSIVVGDFVVRKDPESPYVFSRALRLHLRPLIVQPKETLGGDGQAPPQRQDSLPPLPPLKVLQVQFVGWPDHGVPDSTKSFNALINLIHDHTSPRATEPAGPGDGASPIPPPSPPPVLVHCSAGVGRTGSLIGAYAALHLMKRGLFADGSMKDILRQMRRCRYFSVQRIEQYFYMYEFVLNRFGYPRQLEFHNASPKQAEIYYERLMR